MGDEILTLFDLDRSIYGGSLPEESVKMLDLVADAIECTGSDMPQHLWHRSQATLLKAAELASALTHGLPSQDLSPVPDDEIRSIVVAVDEAQPGYLNELLGRGDDVDDIVRVLSRYRAEWLGLRLQAPVMFCIVRKLQELGVCPRLGKQLQMVMDRSDAVARRNQRFYSPPGADH